MRFSLRNNAALELELLADRGIPVTVAVLPGQMHSKACSAAFSRPITWQELNLRPSD